MKTKNDVTNMLDKIFLKENHKYFYKQTFLDDIYSMFSLEDENKKNKNRKKKN